MIIWLASFPKSGNTWLRSLLSDYINFKNNYSFHDTIYSIEQFPSDYHFDFLLDEGIIDDVEKLQNANFASKYWLLAQQRIILNNKEDVLFKTHGAPCRIENNPFLTKETSRCAICIIRDPRQVLFSLMKHYYFKTQEDSMNFLFENNRSLNVANSNKSNSVKFSHLPMPSWDIYYLSWLAIQKMFPIHFIRYEDMFEINSFKKILTFLFEHTKDARFQLSENKAKKVFERSKFDNLKSLEKQNGFNEAKEKTNGFFNEGKVDTWKNKIEPEIQRKIEKKFEKLMKLFKYL